MRRTTAQVLVLLLGSVRLLRASEVEGECSSSAAVDCADASLLQRPALGSSERAIAAASVDDSTGDKETTVVTENGDNSPAAADVDTDNSPSAADDSPSAADVDTNNSPSAADVGTDSNSSAANSDNTSGSTTIKVAIDGPVNQCTVEDLDLLNNFGPLEGPDSLAAVMVRCGRASVSWFLQWRPSVFLSCLQDTLPLTRPCATCFERVGHSGYANCKLACLASKCSQACLSCVESFEPALHACIGGPYPKPPPPPVC